MNWNQEFLWGNSLNKYFIFLLIIVGAAIILKLFRIFILSKLKKVVLQTETLIDDMVVEVIDKGILPFLQYLAGYIAFKTLSLSETVNRIVDIVMAIIVVYYAVTVLTILLKHWLSSYLLRQNKAQSKEALRGVVVIIQVLLWILGLAFLLDNLGYNIGTMLTGLGIGGIAIALASQNILGDIFAYFSILFDQPFEVGDFLSVGGQSGTVKSIGIRTTRIQSSTGEEISYSNKNILNEWVHNYARLQKRFTKMDLNIAYDTPVEKLRMIPAEIKKIVLSQDKVAFDQAHLFDFGDYYIRFNLSYYSMEPGYAPFLDKRENVYLAISEKFKEMGIQFSFADKREIRIRNSRPEQK